MSVSKLMSKSMLDKLEGVAHNYEDLTEQLSDPEVIKDNKQFSTLSKKQAKLADLVSAYQAYQETLTLGQEVVQMLEDEPDEGMRKFLEEERVSNNEKLEGLAIEIKGLLLPKDPDDHCNVFLEIRAGAGGHEAALFAGDLFGMYQRIAERMGWNLTVVSSHESEHGGWKEMIAEISGHAVFSYLKFESGVHRVQRVPMTESQGRVHTSTCTVAILPVPKVLDEITVDTKDLRIDTYRASGAGGQHVNKTDSAVRITHLPTGVVVECQDERSQHKNKARALTFLQAKLLQVEREKQQERQLQMRRQLVGSGDRSERIRTYNFPQGRITDHRIGLTLYQLEDILAGNLEPLTTALMREDQVQRLLMFDAIPDWGELLTRGV